MGDTAIWYPPSDQPPTGLTVIGEYDDGEIEIRWADERSCILAAYGPSGRFGPGWEDVENGLIVDPPNRWRFI